jgi:hypothetical protein
MLLVHKEAVLGSSWENEILEKKKLLLNLELCIVGIKK